jgi:hypothetical protein
MRKLTISRLAHWFALLTSYSVACTALVQAAELDSLYGIKALGQQLVVRSLEVDSSLPVHERARLPHQRQERLSAIFQNKDRSIGVLSTSTNPDSTRRALVRIAGVPELVSDVSGWEVAGLASSEAISSFLIPMSGPPIALVAHYSDTAPFSVATINFQNGQATAVKMFQLDRHARYARLTQCPNGTIYATSLAQQWDVQLVQMNIAKQTVSPLAELSVYGKPLHGDVFDLACAPSGELYALADPTFSRVNSLFKVNLLTGEMTWVRLFDVDRMIFVQ